MDIKLEYEDLTKKLKESLPIKATPNGKLIMEIKKKVNFLLTLKSELTIINVMNCGDASGILCDVETTEGRRFQCALTNLKFLSSVPNYNKIINYQLKREIRIKQLNQKEID